MLREHAMSVSAAARHASVLAPPEEYAEIGFNYRMTDLQAAVGLVQLGRLPAIVARRREIAAEYTGRAVGRPRPAGRWRPDVGHLELPVVLDRGRARSSRSDRDGLLAHLAEADISARRGIMAAHRQPAYAGAEHLPLPVTERLTDNTLILPVFHQMTDEEIGRVVAAVRSAAGR